MRVGSKDDSIWIRLNPSLFVTPVPSAPLDEEYYYTFEVEIVSKDRTESAACDRNLVLVASFQNLSLERLHLAIYSITHFSVA
jgi:hypothetical protein